MRINARHAAVSCQNFGINQRPARMHSRELISASRATSAPRRNPFTACQPCSARSSFPFRRVKTMPRGETLGETRGSRDRLTRRPFLSFFISLYFFSSLLPIQSKFSSRETKIPSHEKLYNNCLAKQREIYIPLQMVEFLARWSVICFL